MSITVVLAVGLDPWLLTSQQSAWQSAGYFFLSTWSTKEAINQFMEGDFDLVLVGDSLNRESKEKLTLRIRASGSRVPVAWVSDSSDECDTFADAILRSNSDQLLLGMGELLAKRVSIAALQRATIHFAA